MINIIAKAEGITENIVLNNFSNSGKRLKNINKFIPNYVIIS